MQYPKKILEIREKLLLIVDGLINNENRIQNTKNEKV